MSSSRYNAAARAAAIAQKSSSEAPKESKAPDNSVDFLTSYKAASSARLSTANLFTVDVLPDFTPILMFIMFHAIQLSSDIDNRKHPKITTPTFVVYCLSLVYGYFLLSDMYVRPSASAPAQDYFDQPYKKQFSDMLLGLYVPKFLEPIIKNFTATMHEKMPNVVFCASAAGFNVKHHFGRFYPINAFANIHDSAARLDSRTKPNNASATILLQRIFTITDFHSAGNDNMHFGLHHLLGAFASTTRIDPANATNNRQFAHPLRQMFDSLFNPVLSRDYTRRSTLAPLNLESPTFKSYRLSFYDLVFGLTKYNAHELTIVLQSISSNLNGTIPLSGDLASMFKDAAGDSILRHGYAVMEQPLHHCADNMPTDEFDVFESTVTVTTRHPEQAAADHHYLVVPAKPNTGTTHHLASAVCDTDNAHPVTVTQPSADFVLLRDVTRTFPIADANLVPRDNEYLLYDEDRDFAPSVLVLDPTTNSTVSAYMATLTGMVIYSHEIDASAISFPNTEDNNGLQNCQFADSATPYTMVYRPSHYNLSATLHLARKRIRVKDNRFKSALYLIDFAKVYIPRPILTTIDTLVSHGFAGLTFRDNVTYIQGTTSVLAQRVVSTRSNNDALPPHCNFGIISLWSPYSFTPKAHPFWNEKGVFGYYEEHVDAYFIAHPRTMFGTTTALVEVKHYRASMPLP
uniref:Capsid protein n=1 Tax=Rosellinia necatrix partitivirus 21 TaxID=2699389 RepID=A0A6F8QHF4_9VIRU|nr:capsid protein [Rosellinia necatrix partitivirus 21]